ncbi:LOW QUALITY PROTEIN: hypothetical protein U9M48_009756, partial [Paspalum notatum var. saurae]
MLVALKMDFQAGEELGLSGCVASATCIDQNAFSSQLGNSIGATRVRNSIGEQLSPDPENEQVQDMMEKIRLKFRVTAFHLGAVGVR